MFEQIAAVTPVVIPKVILKRIRFIIHFVYDSIPKFNKIIGQLHAVPPIRNKQINPANKNGTNGN